jgi:hypothetical protein
MKKLFTLFSLLLTLQAARAQNILTNGGFEQYTTCPDNQGEISRATAWQNGSQSTPDYYNSCNTGFLSTPSNMTGYKTPFDGVAYGGLYIMNEFGNDQWIEYIMTTFPALQKDTVYKMTINVALAGKNSTYACNGFGVLFTTYGSPAAHLSDNIVATPQVDYSSYGIISDTLNWTTLSKTFTADSAYTHLVFGDFVAPSMLDTMRMPFGTPGANRAYYYIDGVRLEKLSSAIAGVSNVPGGPLVNVYPNPMQQQCRISFSNPSAIPHTLALYNILGQQVMLLQGLTGQECTIQRGTLPAGTYFYKLMNESGTIATGKLEMK